MKDSYQVLSVGASSPPRLQIPCPYLPCSVIGREQAELGEGDEMPGESLLFTHQTILNYNYQTGRTTGIFQTKSSDCFVLFLATKLPSINND